MNQRRAVALVAAALIAAGTGAAVLAQHLTSSNSAQRIIPPAPPSPAAMILVRFNQRRAAAHLPPLKRDAVLASLARIHNRDELRGDFFAHDAPTGQTFAERLAYLHRSAIGEVIAWGTGNFATPQGLVSLWMASPEHKRLILSPAFKRVGISVLDGPYQGQRSARVATADFSS